MTHLWIQQLDDRMRMTPEKGSHRHQARKHSAPGLWHVLAQCDTIKGAKSDCCLKGTNTQNVPKHPMEGLRGQLVDAPFRGTTVEAHTGNDPKRVKTRWWPLDPFMHYLCHDVSQWMCRMCHDVSQCMCRKWRWPKRVKHRKPRKTMYGWLYGRLSE